MGKKDDRIRELLRIVEARGSVTIRDLAVLTNVSELTIRRDVKVMEDKKLVQNVYGTVFYKGQGDSDQYMLSIATCRHINEKKAIGAYAARLIRPGELIIIDNGSTTEQMAAQIPFTAELTVLCYNLNVLNNLYQKPNISLIFCGGFFHAQTLMFESPESLEIIKRTRAARVFVSAGGVHETLGATCASEYELANKREILKSGVERILLADSSKFGTVKQCCFGSLTDFEMIITDRSLSAEWAELIRSKGIKLVMV